MQKLKLVKPSIEDKELILDYKKEFIVSGDSMDGTAGLMDNESFAKWFDELIVNSSEATVREGLVPSSTYLAMTLEDDKLVGIISIRHRLNDFLSKHGGHIGYSVRKSERKKGYATEMLSIALGKCSKLGIERALLTCDKENIGSMKTIVNTGGRLENELPEGDRSTQIYWIEVTT